MFFINTILKLSDHSNFLSTEGFFVRESKADLNAKSINKMKIISKIISPFLGTLQLIIYTLAGNIFE